MKTKTLIPLTDYVLSITPDKIEYSDKLDYFQTFEKLILDYATLLKTPIELGQFMPCDLDGNVLKEPTHLQKMQAGWMDNPIDNNFYKVKEYNEAKERVLFKGCEVETFVDYSLVKFNGDNIWVSWNKTKTIEDLTHLNLELC